MYIYVIIRGCNGHLEKTGGRLVSSGPLPPEGSLQMKPQSSPCLGLGNLQFLGLTVEGV